MRAAIREAEAQIRQSPEEVAAYAARANGYSCWAGIREAMSDYQTIIRLRPDDAVAYNNLAWLLALPIPACAIRNVLSRSR